MAKPRVLAVGAHPDDIEILGGGTLARYVAEGHEVFLGIATDGAAGHAVIPPTELREIRHREATAAAEVLGAQIRFVGEEDEWLFHDRPTREKFIELIRWADPAIILTHSPDDYHPDHRACSDLVFAASFLSTLVHILPDIPAQKSMAALYYMDTLAGVGFDPQFFVDISATFETKLRMLRCHESQLTWLRDHDGIDIEEFMGSMAKQRGLDSGVAYAEAFRAAQAWPRLSPARLLP